MKGTYKRIGMIDFGKMVEDGVVEISRHTESQEIVELTVKQPFEVEASIIISIG